MNPKNSGGVEGTVVTSIDPRLLSRTNDAHSSIGADFSLDFFHDSTTPVDLLSYSVLSCEDSSRVRQTEYHTEMRDGFGPLIERPWPTAAFVESTDLKGLPIHNPTLRNNHATSHFESSFPCAYGGIHYERTHIGCADTNNSMHRRQRDINCSLHPVHGKKFAVPPPSRSQDCEALKCPHCENPKPGGWRFGIVTQRMVCPACGQYENRNRMPRPLLHERRRASRRRAGGKR
ncbi:hypothetical protein C8F01DRAFT_271244 [Mycena amicta]|nr:hypothetical protein C8F01DRAFT_271244 [Mycena amicta]